MTKRQATSRPDGIWLSQKSRTDMSKPSKQEEEQQWASEKLKLDDRNAEVHFETSLIQTTGLSSTKLLKNALGKVGNPDGTSHKVPRERCKMKFSKHGQRPVA